MYEPLRQRQKYRAVKAQNRIFILGRTCNSMWRECREPSVCDFLVRSPQAFLWVKVDHQVKMVAHDGKGINGYGKTLREMKHSLFQPFPAVIVISFGLWIFAAEETPAYAS